MGAWDSGSFDNDTAADWAGDLVEEGDVETVREALVAAAEVPADEYLDSDEGTEAIAAAEVVAAAAGRPGERDAYSEGVLDWAAEHQEAGSPELLELARRAVDRVAGPESELRDLWLEDEEEGADVSDHEWVRAVAELRSRLG